MKQSKISQDLLLLSILTVITVLTWIGFDTYRALTKVEIPKILKEQTAPLNPNLENEVFESLSKRLLPKKEMLVLPTTDQENEATASKRSSR